MLKRSYSQLLGTDVLSVLAFLILLAPPVLAQEELWKSCNDVGIQYLDNKEYPQAEEMLLVAIREAEKLTADPQKLITSLQALRRLYLATNKAAKAEEVATRIKSLGAVPSGNEEKKDMAIAESPPAVHDIAEDVSTSPLHSEIGRSPEIKPESGDLPLRPAQNEPGVEQHSETPAQSSPKPVVAQSQPQSKEEKPPTAVASAVGMAGEMRVSSSSREAVETSQLSGHIDWTRTIQISTDGARVLSGSDDFTVRLWDLGTGKEIHRFDGHEDAVNSVVFSPNGRTALSGSSDRSVRLWDLETGKQVHRFDGHANIVTCVAFSPSGDRAASGGYDGTVRIWDVQSGNQINCMSGNLGTVRCLAFSPDGTQLVSAGSDRLITLWSTGDGHLIRHFVGHKGEIVDLAISSDGSKVLSASRDVSVRLWDLASGSEIHNFLGHGNWVLKAEFLDDKRALSGSLDKTFRVWDLSEGKETACYTIPDLGMWGLGLSKAGDRAITGSNDFTLRLWKLNP